jgi:hypothetical protein
MRIITPRSTLPRHHEDHLEVLSVNLTQNGIETPQQVTKTNQGITSLGLTNANRYKVIATNVGRKVILQRIAGHPNTW